MRGLVLMAAGLLSTLGLVLGVSLPAQSVTTGINVTETRSTEERVVFEGRGAVVVQGVVRSSQDGTFRARVRLEERVRVTDAEGRTRVGNLQLAGTARGLGWVGPLADIDRLHISGEATITWRNGTSITSIMDMWSNRVQVNRFNPETDRFVATAQGKVRLVMPGDNIGIG